MRQIASNCVKLRHDLSVWRDFRKNEEEYLLTLLGLLIETYNADQNHRPICLLAMTLLSELYFIAGFLELISNLLLGVNFSISNNHVARSGW